MTFAPRLLPLAALALALAPAVVAAVPTASSDASRAWPRGAGPPAATGARPLQLALDGFCPVSIHDRGAWVEGRAELAAAFDGQWYFFAGQRERDIFAAAPETYVPVLGGDCLATYAATGERVPGDLRHGMNYRDRLYFFADAERAAEFRADPQALAQGDLYRRGVCPVTFSATGIARPGNPQTVLTAAGLRFYFANASARRQFLAAPQEYLEPALAERTAGAVAREATDPRSAIVASGRGLPVAPGASPELSVLSSSAADGGLPVGAGAKRGEPEADALTAKEPLLSGYCPVSVWTRPESPWVQGRYDQRWQFEDMVFMPAGPAEREKLTSDPALFIPVLGGYCVVTYVETGERVRGSIYHSVIDRQDHRLYLCADAEAADALRRDPEKYAGVDLAAGGKCVVTLRDKNSDVPGDPLIGAWLEGQRYQFVDRAARDRFLAEPTTYTAPLGDE